MSASGLKNVFEYADYRAYLRDFIDARKKAGDAISNRSFAFEIGVNSSSWLTEVLKGSKGISKTIANKISSVCRHKKREAAFFETLVCFNQARTVDQRNFYFRKLVQLRKPGHAVVVQTDQYEYYSTWHHSAIRSLIGILKIRSDVRMLARAVYPPISEVQARASLHLLKRLGFVTEDPDGFLTLTSAAISTGDHAGALSISNYQQETMRLAIESIDRFERPMRDISTVTMGISARGFDRIKSEIQAFRKKIIDIANQDSAIDRVYQFNCQLFPLSNPVISKATS